MVSKQMSLNTNLKEFTNVKEERHSFKFYKYVYVVPYNLFI